LALYEFLSRFYYVCADILVPRKILQLMRWWISYIRDFI
jgi:hypothetical protein